MASRKTKAEQAPAQVATPVPLHAVSKVLEHRVDLLEKDVHALKGSMSTLANDVAILKASVAQVDARSIRGERLMMFMQRDQRRLTRVMEAVAKSLHVTLPPPTPDEPQNGD